MAVVKISSSPVFGQIKSAMGFASFVLKGLQKVKGEFNLVAIAHNLRKIWLHLKVGNKNNMKKPFNYAFKDAVKGQ